MNQNVNIFKSGTLQKPKGCSFYSMTNCDENTKKPMCDEQAKWQGPGGGRSTFYTTWSFYAIIFGSIIVIPFLLLSKFTHLGNNKIFTYILLSLLIGIAINSIGVAVTSQALVVDWKPVSGIPGKESLIREKWVEWFTKLNIRVHLIPVIASIFILILITKIPYKVSCHQLMITSIVLPVIFFFIWASIPVPISPNSKQSTNIFNKASYVYNKPTLLVESTLPITIILITILYVYFCKQ